MSRTFKAGVLAVAFFLFLSLPGLAQTANTGAVSGTVGDTSQRVIPGVDVTATNLETGLDRQTVSGDDGVYSIGLLSPGRYKIEFALTGFQTIIRDGVTVAVTESVQVDVVLEVAGGQQTVTVTDEGQMLQSETSSLGRVVDSRTVTELPLVTRNFTQLTALSPGSSAPLPNSLALGTGAQNVFTNGGTQVSNSYTIDGMEVSNSFSGSVAINFSISGVAQPSVEIIQEFKVQTSMYDASYGRKAGANINMVTKSGTSDFHGSAYHFFRNNVFNANSFFFNKLGADKPVLNQNQFGGTIGGPIVSDRTFFFGSYEGMRQRNGTFGSRTLRLPAIPTTRTRESLGAAFEGQSGFRGGLQVAPDGSNINDVAVNLLNARLDNGEYLIPSPQLSGPGVNYAISIPAIYEQDQFAINIDHQITNNNRLTGKYFFSQADTLQPFRTTNLPGYPYNLQDDNQNVTVSDLHVIGPSTVNEFRIGYARFKGAGHVTPSLLDTEVGIFRATQDVAPGMTRTAVETFGFGNPPLESNTTNNVYSASNIFSFRKGRHNLRLGGEVRFEQHNFHMTNFVDIGTMQFRTVPDFLIGRKAGPVAAGGNGTPGSNILFTLSGSGLALRGLRTRDVAGFIADDWKVSPRLTLNLGLRYDFLGALSDNRGLTSNFDARLYETPPSGGVSSAGLVQPEGTDFPLPGAPQIHPTLLDNVDYNNFAPRFGFAYRPFVDGRIVIRGGYGIFHERIHGRPLAEAFGLTNAPLYRRFLLRGEAANRNASLDDPFPLRAPIDLPVPFEYPGFGAGAPIQVLAVDPLMATPYIQQYNLTVQYAFTPNLLLEVGYAGSKGTRLQSNSLLNQSLLASPEAPVNGETSNSRDNIERRAPFVGISAGSGLRLRDTNGTSNYNSLQASLTKRYSSGLSFLASYTWSKILSTVSTGGAGGFNVDGFSAAAPDSRDIRGTAYGPSNYDRTHRFVFSFTYEFPRPAWNAFASAVFGGWRTAGVVTWQSGVPFDIRDGTAQSLFGPPGGRGTFAPGADIHTARKSGSVHSRLNEYFTSSAFVRAPVIPAGGTTPDGFPVSGRGGTHFGNTGRNIMRGPDQRNVDLALVKGMHITEDLTLEFRSEFFNLFNGVNFGRPGNNIASRTNFGIITSTTSAPRVIQFALKLVF